MYKPAFAKSDLIRRDIAGMAKPPRRIRVSQAATEVVRVASPSGSSEWDASIAPYIVEPMDMLASRRHEAVVFVGPARSGKTQGLVDGWAAYAATCDPGDMLLYFPTEANAYDYSKRRLRRMHENSPRLAEILSPRGHDNSLGMTIYRHGMILSLGWPTSSQMAQKDARYIALSDYDSMPDDVGGEGSAFDLGKKRIQAMMSAGMAMVESSPKRSVIASDWRPSTKHEAPPVDGGILTLYNRGDRRRWYWPCLHCEEVFEAPGLPDYDDLGDVEESAKTARVVCPNCGGIHLPSDKRALQAGGRWIADEKTDGATLATFWVKGTAAAFQPWHSLVRNHLLAMRTFEQTGQEEALRTTVNVDQGMPYMPRAMRSARTAEQLQGRAEWWEVRQVPEGVRYLNCAVDVQGNRFVVQVIGHGVDGERWLIDRFQLTESPRTDIDGNPHPLDPAAYAEDWHVLEPLASAEYPLADGSGRKMRVRMVGIDSGGKGGPQGKSSTTLRAYNFWRAMARKRLGKRFRLLKGHPGGDGKAMVWRTFPDSKRKDRAAGARGDIPLHWVNTLALKDQLDLDLKREEQGAGYIHLPDWIEDELFSELCAEVRGPKKWTANGRNEAFDLFVYDAALDQITALDRGGWKSAKEIDWGNPPAWAKPWGDNSLVTKNGQEEKPFQVKAKKRRRKSSAPDGFAKDGWSL